MTSLLPLSAEISWSRQVVCSVHRHWEDKATLSHQVGLCNPLYWQDPPKTLCLVRDSPSRRGMSLRGQSDRVWGCHQSRNPQ